MSSDLERHVATHWRKLCSLWDSGFCKTYVLYVEAHPFGTGGERLTELKSHILETGCRDCLLAYRLKVLEFEAALLNGEEGLRLFRKGKESSTEKQRDYVLRRANLPEDFLTWSIQVYWRPSWDLMSPTWKNRLVEGYNQGKRLPPPGSTDDDDE